MKELRILGAIELIAYLILGYFLINPIANEGFYFTFGGGIKEALLQMFGAGTITLLPSVYIFYLPVKKLTLSRIQLAKTLQTILFYASCAAILPLLFIAQSGMVEYQILLIASAFGLAFYPFMRKLTAKALKSLDIGKTQT
jgi:hypothetical protein